MAGGYSLQRPADQTTVLDVVPAIEGDGEGFRCAEIRRRGPGAAPETSPRLPCLVHTTMWEAELAWRKSLGNRRWPSWPT